MYICCIVVLKSLKFKNKILPLSSENKLKHICIKRFFDMTLYGQSRVLRHLRKVHFKKLTMNNFCDLCFLVLSSPCRNKPWPCYRRGDRGT